MNCIFCSLERNIVLESRYFYVVNDRYPIANNHMLVISKRHFKSIRNIETKEGLDLLNTIKESISYLSREYLIDNYNFGVNDGVCAGQTIPHFHLHIIPRVIGDVDFNPKGGVRHILQNGKGYY